TALSPEGERADSISWSRKGDRIVFSTQPVDKNNPDRKAHTFVHVMDPMRPGSDKVIARLDGGGWGDWRCSEGGKRRVMTVYISATEASLWVMDAASGVNRRITTQPKGETV